jgi:hypothetical protein
VRNTWSRTRRGVVMAGGLLAMSVAGTPAAAQTRDAMEAKVGCLRGRPRPACKSFWIVEMQGNTPLAQTRRDLTYGDGSSWAVDSFEHVLEWNLGHMVNIGTSFAVGGVVTAGSGSDEPLTGLKVRARRWLSPNVSVELEGGMVRTNASHSVYPAVTGGTADVRLNIRDQGSFYVRWDGVTLPAQGDLLPGGVDPGGFHQAFSVGVGLGSVPALAGTGALGLGLVVLWAMLADES